MSLVPYFADVPHVGPRHRLASIGHGQSGPGDGEPTADPKVVLVVGCRDAVHAVHAVHAALMASGRKVVVASSGDEGGTRVRSGHIDELILNYHLSDIRGDVLYNVAIAYQPHLRTRTIFFVRDLRSPAALALTNFGCPLLEIDSDPAALLRVLAGMDQN